MAAGLYLLVDLVSLSKWMDDYTILYQLLSTGLYFLDDNPKRTTLFQSQPMVYSKSLYDDSQMESDITIITQVNHFMEVISPAQYINPVDYYKLIPGAV